MPVTTGILKRKFSVHPVTPQNVKEV